MEQEQQPVNPAGPIHDTGPGNARPPKKHSDYAPADSAVFFQPTVGPELAAAEHLPERQSRQTMAPRPAPPPTSHHVQTRNAQGPVGSILESSTEHGSVPARGAGSTGELSSDGAAKGRLQGGQEAMGSIQQSRTMQQRESQPASAQSSLTQQIPSGRASAHAQDAGVNASKLHNDPQPGDAGTRMEQLKPFASAHPDLSRGHTNHADADHHHRAGHMNGDSSAVHSNEHLQHAPNPQGGLLTRTAQQDAQHNADQYSGAFAGGPSAAAIQTPAQHAGQQTTEDDIEQVLVSFALSGRAGRVLLQGLRGTNALPGASLGPSSQAPDLNPSPAHQATISRQGDTSHGGRMSGPSVSQPMRSDVVRPIELQYAPQDGGRCLPSTPFRKVSRPHRRPSVGASAAFGTLEGLQLSSRGIHCLAPASTELRAQPGELPLQASHQQHDQRIPPDADSLLASPSSLPHSEARIRAQYAHAQQMPSSTPQLQHRTEDLPRPQHALRWQRLGGSAPVESESRPMLHIQGFSSGTPAANMDHESAASISGMFPNVLRQTGGHALAAGSAAAQAASADVAKGRETSGPQAFQNSHAGGLSGEGASAPAKHDHGSHPQSTSQVMGPLAASASSPAVTDHGMDTHAGNSVEKAGQAKVRSAASLQGGGGHPAGAHPGTAAGDVGDADRGHHAATRHHKRLQSGFLESRHGGKPETSSPSYQPASSEWLAPFAFHCT